MVDGHTFYILRISCVYRLKLIFTTSRELNLKPSRTALFSCLFAVCVNGISNQTALYKPHLYNQIEFLTLE
jgi:hypothetical protein